MRKGLFFIITMVLAFTIALSSCKKDKTNNEGNYNNQEYPSTAHVIRKAVTDIDGNIYDAVQIGNQVWMAENLRTTRYADGTVIPLGTSTSSTTAYRYAPGPNPNNEDNMINVPRYGYLYNWTATMHGASSSDANPSGVQGICPNGWHVPSEAEWVQLKNYMQTQPEYLASGYPQHLAKALAATWGWTQNYSDDDAPGNNPSTNNASGFSALPANYYLIEGPQDQLGYAASFWSSTRCDINGFYHAHYRMLMCFDPILIETDYLIEMGCSVRCVRN